MGTLSHMKGTMLNTEVFTYAPPPAVYVAVSDELLATVEPEVLEHLLLNQVLSLIKEDLENALKGLKDHSDHPLGEFKNLWNAGATPPGALVKYNAELKSEFTPSPLGGGRIVMRSLIKAVPGLKNAKGTCPANKKCGDEVYHNRPLSDVIIHLNDQHHWTREQIADWLDTLDVDLSFVAPPDDQQPEDEGVIAGDYIAEYQLKFLETTIPDPEAFVKLLGLGGGEA